MRKIYVLVLGLIWAATGSVFAQEPTPQPNWPVTNNFVRTIVKSGNTVYYGGNFSYIGPNVPYGVGIDVVGATPIANYVKPNGSVNSVAPDGVGGWYIGGTFTYVGGIARNKIARINSDGTLHAWNPNADGNVNTIHVSGNTIYVGGVFTTIGGELRNRLAAFDATTGNITPWDPNANNSVSAVAVSGTTVYVGGGFTSIGGQNRNRIAALDAVTGLATAWDPAATISSGLVNSLISVGNTLYVGGTFGTNTIGGQPRKYLLALDATTALATTWAPEPSSTINTLKLEGTTLYAGGGFTSIAGQPRNRIASFDIGTGNLNAWNPDANTTVNAIEVSGSSVYVGGLFTTIAGTTRSRFAAFDKTTGAITSWDPSVSSSVLSIAANNGVVYAGGNFTSIGGKMRNGIAAVNGNTGLVTDWDPNITSGTPQVNSIIVNGGSVYFGGNFTAVNSMPRNRAAAVDEATGSVLGNWNPGIGNGQVYAMVFSSTNNRIYLGGNFTQVNGVVANHTGLAAVDLTNGTLIPGWSSLSNSAVNSLLLDGSSLYVGGQFTSIGGQPRNRIASFDISTGLLNSWDPNAGTAGNVLALAKSGTTIYAGGSFTTMGGQARSRLASIDASTGSVGSWDPNASASVNAIVVNGNSVYVGGDYTALGVGGSTLRNRLAAIDASSGTAIANWDPNMAAGGASFSVYNLMLDNNNLFVGGSYSTVQNIAYAYASVLNTVESSLPVKLLSFNARAISGSTPSVLCSWETAQEINFSRFVVERSSDGKNYKFIGTVAAAGNASIRHQYSFTDNEPLTGSAYYRLKQIDRDGTYSYSKVVLIAGQKESMAVLLYPNPAKYSATLSVSLPSAGHVRYSIYDQHGKLLATQSLYLNSGNQNIHLPIQQLPAGIYSVVLNGASATKQLQLVKQ